MIGSADPRMFYLNEQNSFIYAVNLPRSFTHFTINMLIDVVYLQHTVYFVEGLGL